MYDVKATSVRNTIAANQEMLNNIYAMQEQYKSIGTTRFGAGIAGNGRNYLVPSENIVKMEQYINKIGEGEQLIARLRVGLATMPSVYQASALSIVLALGSLTFAVIDAYKYQSSYLNEEMWIAPNGAYHGDKRWKLALNNIWSIHNYVGEIDSLATDEIHNKPISLLGKASLIKKVLSLKFVDIEDRSELSERQFMLDGVYFIPGELQGAKDPTNSGFLIDSWGVGNVSKNNTVAFATQADRDLFEQACYVFQAKNKDKKVYLFNNYFQNNNDYRWWDDMLIKQRAKTLECLDTINKLNIEMYSGGGNANTTVRINDFYIIQDSGAKQVKYK